MIRKINLSKLAKKQGESLTVGETGRFTGYASVWGVPDDTNDVMQKGCFADSIAKYAEEGRKFPVRYMHGNDGPVGVIENIYEDDHGLFVEGVIQHEVSDRAKEAYEMVKSGAVSEMSVGFYYVDGGIVYDSTTKQWSIFKADLREVSLVDVGSNSETRILTIKSHSDDDDLKRADKILDGIISANTQSALDAAISKMEKSNG